jgi:hypothetical protein
LALPLGIALLAAVTLPGQEAPTPSPAVTDSSVTGRLA